MACPSLPPPRVPKCLCGCTEWIEWVKLVQKWVTIKFWGQGWVMHRMQGPRVGNIHSAGSKGYIIHRRHGSKQSKAQVQVQRNSSLKQKKNHLTFLPFLPIPSQDQNARIFAHIYIRNLFTKLLPFVMWNRKIEKQQIINCFAYKNIYWRYFGHLLTVPWV